VRAAAECRADTEQRLYRGLFGLAQRLTALPHVCGADAGDLADVVSDWYRRAWGAGRWTSAEVLSFWRRAWADVELPVGTRPIDLVWKQAEHDPPPPGTDRYKKPYVVALAALCLRLQRRAGRGKPFYLSCRVAGGLMGRHHATAARWLGWFRRDGFLSLAAAGNLTTGASWYYYIAPWFPQRLAAA
jgi:hypothetical protein